MEEARLAGSIFVTLLAAVFMFGGRYIILDSQSRAYCECRHEYNEHNIIPQGYTTNSEHSSGTCKLCRCKQWKKNDKDKRNTPPVKFFPHPFK